MPARITNTSAMIIDNFYTNVINDGSNGRVLIDDITDHMHIIFTWPGSIYKNDTEIEDSYKRMVNTKSIGSLNCLLRRIGNIFSTATIQTQHTQRFLDMF